MVWRRFLGIFQMLFEKRVFILFYIQKPIQKHLFNIFYFILLGITHNIQNLLVIPKNLEILKIACNRRIVF